ncbi:hypothetical protein HYH02_014569 [Chlamydomonas schloesseri]|uniref:TPX2 C-terminal domain-containing protein n=1 Tax=Chlamydomonas schloesseri TaxID=2026947 RepID=A0A835SI11_9CHLO|nr:hypothetical protein HYH02_014569 [Chlamydomonas schloesseri]|eukprot:KAG2427523.1 hypothetical protein HYH02_014569 [Chlamydomonas schloesseri]
MEALIDSRYEFDAPQHYDFEAENADSVGSAWFAAQEAAVLAEEEADNVANSAPRMPLKEKNSESTAGPSKAAEASKATKKESAVPEAQKKRKAKEGGSVKGHVAKAAKGNDKAAGTAPATAAPKTRAQHAAAAASVPAEGQGKASKELKPVKVAMKLKAKPKAAQLLVAKAKAAAAGKAAAGVASGKGAGAGGAAEPKAGAAAGAKAGRALAKVLQPKRVMTLRSTKQLTVPQDVELATTRRAAAHGGTKGSKPGGDGGKQVEQPQQQRDGGDGDEADPAGSDAEEGSPYKPLVLRVKEFDKTPGRFKRKPDQPMPSKPLSITEAKEPKLLTNARSRPPVFKPREVAEAEAMAAMPQFRASTLNPLVLHSSGLIGVPKVEKRELTLPQPFHFISDDRAEVRMQRQLQLQQEQQQAGGSNPAAGPSGSRAEDKAERELPKRARKSVACNPELAVPRSPMLRTKLRARESKIPEEPQYEFRARPVPKFLSVPGVELPAGHHGEPPAPTVPEPFRLATEQRGTAHRSAMAARLAAEEEAAKRARVPRALGLPLSTDMPLVPPRPEPKSLTVPEPFGLASEARHEEHEERRRRALQEEEAARRAEAEFKARPMWKGAPFRPHDSGAVLTVPEEVPLATSARAAEREVFDRAVQEKWKEAEVAQQLAAQEARMREEEERRQLRKAAVFHARPMPDLSAPPAAKPPPAKPLTKPVSPRLGRNKRRAGQGAAGEETEAQADK